MSFFFSAGYDEAIIEYWHYGSSDIRGALHTLYRDRVFNILLAFITVILAAGLYFTFRYIRSLNQKVDEVDKRFFVPFRATESLSKKVDRIEDELKWTNHSIESLSKKIDNKTNKIEESLEWLNWMKDHLHIDGVIEELAEKLEQKMEEYDEDDENDDTTIEEKILLNRLKLVAEAYSSLNAELLIGALAENSTYISQWVMEDLEGKDAIAKYIREKFKTIKKHGISITCSLRRVLSGPFNAIGKPCIVMCTDEGDECVILVDLSDEDQIERILLCFAPGPSDTVPLENDIEMETKSESESITPLSRYKGSLLGLAVGDALGTTLEFKEPGEFEPICDMMGGGPFNLEAGEWTDDTSMALCLADSLIEKEKFDPTDQMQRYLKFFHKGYLTSNGTCFDIGNTIHTALKKFQLTNEPYCGSKDPNTAGNGSLMRLAPIPLAYANNEKVAIEKAAESSRTTHGTENCVDACRYMTILMLAALKGETKEAVLNEIALTKLEIWDQKPLAPKIAAIASGSYIKKNPPDIKGTGYVVESLEAALWAFYNSESFEEGALMAVNLGNDADTTGAIYGQLAGAYYGEEGIPEKWKRVLAHRGLITQFAEELFDLKNRIEI